MTKDEIINTFIVHSNLISKYYRLRPERNTVGNMDLLEDIMDLYDFQCVVENLIAEGKVTNDDK